jgi:cytochrome c biogenesis protein CcmG/thiol:disulfide interchange protein DsbE
MSQRSIHPIACASWAIARSSGPVLALFILASTGCGAASAAIRPDESHQGSVVGREVPELRLAPLNGGNGVRLTELRGKVVLLDVWASWCAPCKEELPMLDDMVGRLRSKGIEVVAVSIDENRQDAEEFLRSRPSWSIRFAHDPEGNVSGNLQPPKMPSSFLIDREGVIRGINAGFTRDDAERIEERLVELAATSSSERIAASSHPSDAPQTGDSNSSPTSLQASAPSHPVPTVSGSIDGRPFEPKLARVAGRMQKDGRILLSLSERTDCAPPSDLKPGDATLTMMVPWKNGYMADLASLKRPNKKGAAAIAFSRVNNAKKKAISKTFKPSGTVTIVSAPMEPDAIGKMKIDLASGDYVLAGDLDIQLCVSPK